MNPIRRMRVQFFADHRPQVWAAYYEPPGSRACYCHAPTLEAMWKELEAYFNGNGLIQPLRVEDRLMRHFRPSDEARVRRPATPKPDDQSHG